MTEAHSVKEMPGHPIWVHGCSEPCFERGMRKYTPPLPLGIWFRIWLSWMKQWRKLPEFRLVTPLVTGSYGGGGSAKSERSCRYRNAVSNPNNTLLDEQGLCS